MISEHFARKEFACGDGCGFAACDIELVSILEKVRAHFHMPVTITSGCRCESHNKNIGGKPKSLHLRGMAADFMVKGFRPEEVQEWLLSEYPEKYGIGRANTFTHIDVRPYAARWRY